MLSWINITAAATDDCNMTSYIKCHCSSGQYCEHYKDPDTGMMPLLPKNSAIKLLNSDSVANVASYATPQGEPLNFNYLPELADARMGLMPHTVQFYNFSDPANTYGSECRRGLQQTIQEDEFCLERGDSGLLHPSCSPSPWLALGPQTQTLRTCSTFSPATLAATKRSYTTAYVAQPPSVPEKSLLPARQTSTSHSTSLTHTLGNDVLGQL